MSNSALALIGFCGWTLFLVCWIAALRTTLVLSGSRRANSFQPSGEDVSPFSHRLCRAHANCCENLPIFAALILVALSLGRADVTDPLALWCFGARLGQSTVHLISLRTRFVMARFSFMVVQVAILLWWVLQLLRG